MEAGGGRNGRSTLPRRIVVLVALPVHVQLSLRSRLLHFFTSPPPCESSSAAFVIAEPTAPTGAPQHRTTPTDMLSSLPLPLARELTRRLRPRTLCSARLSGAPMPRWAAHLGAPTATWSGWGMVVTV